MNIVLIFLGLIAIGSTIYIAPKLKNKGQTTKYIKIFALIALPVLILLTAISKATGVFPISLSMNLFFLAIAHCVFVDLITFYLTVPSFIED